MKNIKTFIGDCVLKYSKHGSDILFKAQKYLRDGKMEYTGEADKDGIRIATGDDLRTWVEVFVHETCHVDQHIERPRWFNNAEISLQKISDWLEGKEVKGIGRAIRIVQALEHDCESRAIDKIKKHKLEINLKEYIQKANSYLVSYSITKKNRKWIPAPYSNKEIYSKFPVKLMTLKQLQDPDWEFLKQIKLYVVPNKNA